MVNTNKYFYSILALLLLIFPGRTLFSQPLETKNGIELKMALNKMEVLGSALYIAAHPDDENTTLLAYLAKERLLRTGYLSLTRGGGGQNLIGTEKGAVLSVLRTQELLAARRIDGAEQFFTRAVDFGYSKSADETIKIWNRQSVLSDIVWVIRKFRPDVIITRFSSESGGHGHHTASAILTAEAFEAAAEPDRFPEQLSNLTTWQAKRLLWNTWRPDLSNRNPNLPPVLSLDLGTYNPLLGESYTETAARSRSMHKSQGFGVVASRGSSINYFEHVKGEAAEKDIFEGIDSSWQRVPGSQGISRLLKQANQAFSSEKPADSIPLLLKALADISELQPSYWQKRKYSELVDVIRSCAGLWLETSTDRLMVSPGDTIKLRTTIINRSRFPFQLEQIDTPQSNETIKAGDALRFNQPVVKDFNIILPNDLPFSHPYWLREKPGLGAYNNGDSNVTGLATQPPLKLVKVLITAPNVPVSFSIYTPLFYRWRDPVDGERIRAVEVVPPLAINLSKPVILFPDQSSKIIEVTLKSLAQQVSGVLKLRLPEGWRVQPDRIPFAIQGAGKEKNLDISITPPASDTSAQLDIRAVLKSGTVSHGIRNIRYNHIPEQTLISGIDTKLIRLQLKMRGQRIGYIMGSGDDIPMHLLQIGYRVTDLTDEILESADLSLFDAIITGVRAYNTRDILSQKQEVLLDYVSGGGTLIVQYNTNRGLRINPIGPYPLRISRDRVTDENAAIHFLLPEHPIFHQPNRITRSDFDHWVQERGLYFANQWDARYQPLLSSSDPGESQKKGGLLICKYGEGHFVYSAYSWFRQLPAGVPGAFKLFVNMISLKTTNGSK